MSLRLVLIALLLVVAGCGQGAAEPDDAMPPGFVGEISYRNGSVAPPYHYEWRVELGERTARLEWTPGYDGTETWADDVDLDEAARKALYDRLRRAGLFEFAERSGDELVGGPTGRATFGRAPDVFHDSGTLGATEAGQDMLAEVVAATRSVFPDEVWSAMEQRQRDWGARQPR